MYFYHDQEFATELAAKWAVFFDVLSIKSEYIYNKEDNSEEFDLPEMKIHGFIVDDKNPQDYVLNDFIEKGLLSIDKGSFKNPEGNSIAFLFDVPWHASPAMPIGTVYSMTTPAKIMDENQSVSGFFLPIEGTPALLVMHLKPGLHCGGYLVASRDAKSMMKPEDKEMWNKAAEAARDTEVTLEDDDDELFDGFSLDDGNEGETEEVFDVPVLEDKPENVEEIQKNAAETDVVEPAPVDETQDEAPVQENFVEEPKPEPVEEAIEQTQNKDLAPKEKIPDADSTANIQEKEEIKKKTSSSVLEDLMWEPLPPTSEESNNEENGAKFVDETDEEHDGEVRFDNTDFDEIPKAQQTIRVKPQPKEYKPVDVTLRPFGRQEQKPEISEKEPEEVEEDLFDNDDTLKFGEFGTDSDSSLDEDSSLESSDAPLDDIEEDIPEVSDEVPEQDAKEHLQSIADEAGENLNEIEDTQEEIKEETPAPIPEKEQPKKHGFFHRKEDKKEESSTTQQPVKPLRSTDVYLKKNQQKKVAPHGEEKKQQILNWISEKYSVSDTIDYTADIEMIVDKCVKDLGYQVSHDEMLWSLLRSGFPYQQKDGKEYFGLQDTQQKAHHFSDGMNVAESVQKKL